jgi:hypothetical protein
MKKIILNFKRTIRFLVSIIISREFSFVYCILGTIAQVAHCYFLLESVSSLSGNWKVFQAVLLSIFISSSLLYFVAIADNTDQSEEGIKEYKKVLLAINLFTVIEILINIYYYSRHLIIDQENYQIFDFIFAILISCLIPITIKLYSSSIRAKSWMLEFEDNNVINISSQTNIESISEEKLLEILQPMISNFEKSLNDIEDINQEKINKLIEDKLKDLNNDIDKQISTSYQKNQDLFLKQFENKVKTLSNDYFLKIKNTSEAL